MFQDYEVAYSEEGDAHKEEAQSTVTVGWGCGFKSSHPVHFFLLYNYDIELSSLFEYVEDKFSSNMKTYFLLVPKPLELSTALILSFIWKERILT